MANLIHLVLRRKLHMISFHHQIEILLQKGGVVCSIDRIQNEHSDWFIEVCRAIASIWELVWPYECG